MKTDLPPSNQPSERHGITRLLAWVRSSGVSWPIGLIAGFTAQFVLFFVVATGVVSELDATDARLRTLVGEHMLRLELTKTMHAAARDRTMSLARMINLHDPFDHDVEQQRFHQHAVEFGQARAGFLALPLTPAEQALLEQQRQLTHQAIPYQEKIIELSNAGLMSEAQSVLTQNAIPAQDAVMQVLSQLDDLTRQAANQAMLDANTAHEEARRWIITLSTVALLLGFLIAALVVIKIRRSNMEREHLATHDPLTGLPNRLLLLDRLDQAILRSKRQHTQVGLLFIDLDGFKEVNDTLGHAAGDELLKQIALRLRKVVREVDIIARLGGDEFIIGILDAANTEQVSLVAEKLLKAISQPAQIAGQEVAISGSVGVCVYPSQGPDAEALLKCADAAMYAAKEAGKNQVRHYSPELGQTTPKDKTDQVPLD